MALTVKVLVCLSVLAYALAVDMNCTTMLPTGTAKYDDKPSPIIIRVSSTTFKKGQTITVNVSSANAFHHFLLQAQTTAPVGTFVNAPTSAVYVIKTCVSDGDSVTHSDEAGKREISFTWIAPDNVDSFKFVGSFHVADSATAHKVESVQLTKREEDDEEEEEEETGKGEDEEEGEEAEDEKQMREEKEATAKLREEERKRLEADNVARPGAPIDPTEEPTTTTTTAKPSSEDDENDMEGEEGEEGDADEEEEESVDPDETEDKIREYKEKEERIKMIEYERHQKEIMDEREDYLRRMEEETGGEEEEEKEEEKRPDGSDKEKERVEEKEGEKTKVTDGSGSSAACATISIATILTAAVLSLF